jgi:hypothetical protein
MSQPLPVGNASYLLHRAGVPCDQRVGGQQGYALDRALGDRHAVERILVQRRQSRVASACSPVTASS